MRARNSIALAALAVALLAPTAVSARGSDAAAAKAEHNRIVNYWTAERLASAKHKDYVRNGQGKLVPFAKPGGGGGAVSGASWTGNGEIEKRSGKLFFSTSAGNWQCSASVVNDGNTSGGYSIILTAGHCTYDGAEGWSFNVLYLPDYDDAPTKTCSATVYGCWTASQEAVNTTFLSEGGFGSEASVAVDYGFMKMRLGGKTGQTQELDAITGGYGINTASLANSVEKWAFGYPAAGRYHGADLVYCKGQTINDPYGANTWGVACNMTGGSSGGPWIYGNSNPATYTAATLLTSLNSYGYSGLTYMFGPKFNNATQTVANAAGSGSGAGATVHSIP